MNPMLNIAIQAVRQSGNFIIKQYQTVNINNTKTTEHNNNLLVKINNKSNQLINNVIKKYYPSHIVTTQNTSNSKTINQAIQWIINPLDGQINFIKHLPYFTSSIAVKIKGQTEIAVIYDPIHNDLFSASKGQGTQLNGFRIHHNNITKNFLYQDPIITFFPCHNTSHTIMNILNTLIHHMQKYMNFRYSGATTLDLAYIAAGRIDALFVINAKTHKTDSGVLLIKESGGLILNLDENDKKNHIYRNIIAGNPKFIQFITNKIPTLKKFY